MTLASDSEAAEMTFILFRNDSDTIVHTRISVGDSCIRVFFSIKSRCNPGLMSSVENAHVIQRLACLGLGGAPKEATYKYFVKREPWSSEAINVSGNLKFV